MAEDKIDIMLDDTPGAVVITVGPYRVKVSREAVDADPDDYSTGAEQFEDYGYCVFCGRGLADVGDKAGFWGSDFAICEEDYYKRIVPLRDANEKWREARKNGETDFLKFYEDVPDEDYVEPHCSYCGKRMVLFLPVVAGNHLKFVWVCPDRHSNLATDSPDGIDS